MWTGVLCDLSDLTYERLTLKRSGAGNMRDLDCLRRQDACLDEGLQRKGAV